MIQYFKNIDQKTIAIDKHEDAVWVNVLPPLKQEEFSELSENMDIPIDFLKDSLDIDERSRYELFSVGVLITMSFTSSSIS